ncbi:glutamate decarboxylase 1 [Plakobranchus ocellatus]|uniref:Glutamate decarboxylase 1 n=1 Tax=Plakobranchus ocellatus TaxID=259542 RepID=A0AAV4AWU7_9GAST|nr:glutamate decarboxylase 1 [Plakobranchus ocellatus]
MTVEFGVSTRYLHMLSERSLRFPSTTKGRVSHSYSDSNSNHKNILSHHHPNTLTDFTGFHGKDMSSHFLSCLTELLTTYVQSEGDRSTKVLDFHHPHQLAEMMSHCLEIHPEARDMEQLLSDCRETLKYCVKTGHPHFFNQLSTGVDIVGVAGAWLAASANTNMFTYEAAPVFTLMEEVVLTRMRKLIGWEDGEAMFAPGGAISNLYGVLLARHRHSPDVKTKGINGARLVIMTSEQSHFSITRAAMILGIGTTNVIYIKCHSNGKMDVKDLKDQISKARRAGIDVLMVNATCGTTVLGAYDPLDDMADICQEFGIWLHCDCAWGGGALLSRDYKHLVKGIHSYLRDRVKVRAGFHLIVEEIEAPNVCFWYLPTAWRTRPLSQIKDEHLHKIAPAVKARMMEAGTLMVQYQPLGNMPNLFRVAVSNPALTRSDLDFLLDELDNMGNEIPVPSDW